MKLNSMILAAIAATALSLGSPSNVKATDDFKSAASKEEASSPWAINKATHIIGMTVKNEKGDKLGTIKNMVLNLQSGEVAYVVLRKSSAKRGTGKYIALPLDALSPSADQKHLIVDAD